MRYTPLIQNSSLFAGQTSTEIWWGHLFSWSKKPLQTMVKLLTHPQFLQENPRIQAVPCRIWVRWWPMPSEPFRAICKVCLQTWSKCQGKLRWFRIFSLQTWIFRHTTLVLEVSWILSIFILEEYSICDEPIDFHISSMGGSRTKEYTVTLLHRIF